MEVPDSHSKYVKSKCNCTKMWFAYSKVFNSRLGRGTALASIQKIKCPRHYYKILSMQRYNSLSNHNDSQEFVTYMGYGQLRGLY